MFRTIGDGPSAWELLLPAEVLRLPEDLAQVDALLDDPAFFAPFARYFHLVLGRPSTPGERGGGWAERGVVGQGGRAEAAARLTAARGHDGDDVVIVRLLAQIAGLGP